MEATATEVKNKFGKFSDIARNEPVIVKKTGRRVIGLIAFEKYERLTQIERNRSAKIEFILSLPICFDFS